MSWFYLALLAPLLYAIVNLLDDNLLHSIYRGPYLATAASGILGALPLLSLFFVDWTSIEYSQAGLMILAGFLTTIFYFFYFKSLAVDSPSVVVAMMGLVPAIVPILAYYFLGERLVGAQLVGFAIVLLATMALAVVDIRKFKFSAALLWVLVAVAITSVVSIMTKYVYDQAAFYPAYMSYVVGIGLGGIYFALIMYYDKRQHDMTIFKKSIHKVFAIFLVAELIAIAADFMSNLAISRGSVSLVRVIEGIQPMYVLIIAIALYPIWPKYFREAAEAKRTKKLVLMSVILAGLILIHRSA